MKVIKAPNNIDDRILESSTVFLAGSIAMGKVEDWQEEISNKLSDYSDEVLTIYNPRRDDFDTTLVQTANEPILAEQIHWELDSLEDADYILMYFHPDTYAPITLLEMGMHVDNFCKLIVCCPDGFYRQANVEIVCQRYKIPFFKELDKAVEEVCEYIDYDHNIGRYSED